MPIRRAVKCAFGRRIGEIEGLSSLLFHRLHFPTLASPFLVPVTYRQCLLRTMRRRSKNLLAGLGLAYEPQRRCALFEDRT